MISFFHLFACGLAAWRFAFFVTDDSLAQPTKEKLLGKFARRAGQNKKLVGLSEKADELFDCIYCLTFWSSLLLLTLTRFSVGYWFISLGAVWAVATLIGVTHNLAIETVKENPEENVE